MNPVLVTTALVWGDLDDTEKLALRLTAEWPGKSLKGTVAWEKAQSLATGPGDTLHAATIDAIRLLAARWHQEAGR